jgi:hypothetical protein
MKIVSAIFAAAAVIAFVAVVGLGTSWLGLLAGRSMQAYAEDTRRLTFEHSRAHRDGENQTISDYCLNMREARDPAQKTAMARFIHAEAASYEGALTEDARACVAEADAALG